jgi:hypothetical protein
MGEGASKPAGLGRQGQEVAGEHRRAVADALR